MSGQRKSMTWDAKSFVLDGKRVWLHDGEIHYFRFPCEEWRDALLRAKRAGLNCVSTYVAWCYHEENEGTFDFSGDRDLCRFIDIAHELGLKVMVRVGPYMCGEWAGGGIPGWLGIRDNIDLRTNDPVFMAAVEKWFGALMPGIVERQVTRGGAVVSVQNENEYHRACAGPRRDYIYAIRDLLRRLGVDVPITGCNAHPVSDTEVQLYYSRDPKDWALDGIIVTYNCPPNPEPLKHLRKIQPNAPLIATELWAGGMVFRTTDRNGWPEMGEYMRGITRFFGHGAQVCYYMFDGGTNHGYWGGCNIATSYESDYPVREGGVVGERYRALRLANVFASSFGDLLADSDEDAAHGIGVEDGILLLARSTSAGRMLFLTAPDSRWRTALALPGGKTLPVEFNEFSCAILPLELECVRGVTLNVSNMSLFLRDESRRVVVLHAPAGTEAFLRVNGRDITRTIRRNMVERVVVPCTDGAATIFVLETNMAKRCWPLCGRIAFGPDYVGEEYADGRFEMIVSTPGPAVCVFDDDGAERTWTGTIPSKAAPLPGLAGWLSCVAPELSDTEETGWTPLDEPEYHDALGVRHGYVWFRAWVNAARDGVSQLAIPGAQGNVIVHVNGDYAGTLGIERTVNQRMDYGIPMQRLNATLGVPLRKGRNHIVCLAEDCGHTLFETGSVGMRGSAFVGARPFEPENMDVRDDPERDGGKIVAFDVPLRRGERAVLVFTRHCVAVRCDGRNVAPVTQRRDFWRGFVARPSTGTGRARIELLLMGYDVAVVTEKMVLHIVRDADRLRDWAWKPFTPVCGGAGMNEAACAAPTGTGKPVLLVPTHADSPIGSRVFRASWHVAHFARPEGKRPVFFTLGNLNKGQLWLNGKNVGRFWKQPQTQTHWYLPRAWMKDDNELVVFEETGLGPAGAALAWKESDAYHPEKASPLVTRF